MRSGLAAVVVVTVVVAAQVAVADELGVVVGVVTDDDGTIAGATVRLVTTGRDPVYVETDHDGKWRLELPVASWAASVADPTHVAASGEVIVAAGRERACDVRLATLRHASLEMIGGVVTSPSGPVAGAHVEAHRTDGAVGDIAVASTVTDRDGRYELVLATTSRYSHGFTLIARARGFAPADRDISTGWDKTADFALHPGGAIAGVVRDARGRPVPHARVTIEHHTMPRLDDTGPTRTLVADDAGAFAFDDLGAGTHDVSAGGEPAVVPLAMSERVAGVELRVAR